MSIAVDPHSKRFTYEYEHDTLLEANHTCTIYWASFKLYGACSIDVDIVSSFHTHMFAFARLIAHAIPD